mgnify:CR=1 FL=1|jgi:flagellar biosynthesis chaperone FliJ
MEDIVKKYVGKLQDELTNTGGPKAQMNKQVKNILKPVVNSAEKEVEKKINKLSSSMSRCNNILCKLRIRNQIRKLQKRLGEDKNMGAIFENEAIVRMFIREYGDRFTDAHLLLEQEQDDLEECKDGAVFKVTNEEEDIDECNESDRICEDVLIEFNPDIDKKLYSKFKKSFKGGKKPLINPKSLSFKNLAVGTLLASAIYYAAQTYRTLRAQGKDPVVARREQVQALKYAMSKCNRTKNPKLCRDKFEKQIRITQGKPTL